MKLHAECWQMYDDKWHNARNADVIVDDEDFAFMAMKVDLLGHLYLWDYSISAKLFKKIDDVFHDIDLKKFKHCIKLSKDPHHVAQVIVIYADSGPKYAMMSMTPPFFYYEQEKAIRETFGIENIGGSFVKLGTFDVIDELLEGIFAWKRQKRK